MTSSSKTARYHSLDQAWQAIRSDGTRLADSTSADWRAAVSDVEQDWAAITDQWQQLTND